MFVLRYQMEFCTTATVRPEILDRTYESFFTNLQGLSGPHTLYINIDPIPSPSGVDAVLAVCNRYFQNVVSNLPQTPSFPAAVKWCLAQPKEQEFFYLEDDWLLTSPIHIDEMRRQFGIRTTVVNLRAYSIKDSRICLSPSLWKRETGHAISKRLDTLSNPEKQLRPITGSNPGGNKHIGFYSIQFPEKIVLEDIGRPWLRDSTDMVKNLGVHFTTWAKKTDAPPAQVVPQKPKVVIPTFQSVNTHRQAPVVAKRIAPHPIRLKPRIER